MYSQVDRRRLLIGLAFATFALTGGCALLRRKSELEAAAAELEDVLGDLQSADESELLALAEKLKKQSLELQEAHSEFARSFSDAARVRQTSDETLHDLVAGYEARRIRSRRELLEVQDALHAMIPDDDWPGVLAVLNTKAQAVASKATTRS